MRGTHATATGRTNTPRVNEFTARNILIVKHPAPGKDDWVTIFSVAAPNEAREFAKPRGLIVCACIWQGALKIGDVIPEPKPPVA